MSLDIVVEKLTAKDRISAHGVLKRTILDLFEKEGLTSLKEFCTNEIAHKKDMVDHALSDQDPDTVFFVAMQGGKVIGTISHGPCGDEIKACAGPGLTVKGELGSLYVLPEYQGQGIGSRLIRGVTDHLHQVGIGSFCLDSGYRSAQARWVKKFGPPWIISKDHWGEGADHMVWLCYLKDLGYPYAQRGRGMNEELIIAELSEADREAAYRVYELTVPDAFEKDGFGGLKDLMRSVIEHKKAMIDHSLDDTDPDTFFLAAKMGGQVIGAISFGPSSEDITKCSDGRLDDVGELGSLFILPQYQANGVGSKLIQALLVRLDQSGIEEFCLYSGFKEAQKVWLSKFGDPFITKKNYWGKGVHNMIWLCRTKDFLQPA